MLNLSNPSLICCAVYYTIHSKDRGRRKKGMKYEGKKCRKKEVGETRIEDGKGGVRNR